MTTKPPVPPDVIGCISLHWQYSLVLNCYLDSFPPRICLSNEDDSGLLVASGIAGRQNDHALDVCRLALDILSKCATFEVKHRPSLRYS